MANKIRRETPEKQIDYECDWKIVDPVLGEVRFYHSISDMDEDGTVSTGHRAPHYTFWLNFMDNFIINNKRYTGVHAHPRTYYHDPTTYRGFYPESYREAFTPAAQRVMEVEIERFVLSFIESMGGTEKLQLMARNKSRKRLMEKAINDKMRADARYVAIFRSMEHDPDDEWFQQQPEQRGSG